MVVIKGCKLCIFFVRKTLSSADDPDAEEGEPGVEVSEIAIFPILALLMASFLQMYEIACLFFNFLHFLILLFAEDDGCKACEKFGLFLLVCQVC